MHQFVPMSKQLCFYIKEQSALKGVLEQNFAISALNTAAHVHSHRGRWAVVLSTTSALLINIFTYQRRYCVSSLPCCDYFVCIKHVIVTHTIIRRHIVAVEHLIG